MPATDIETLLDYETPIEKMFAHLFGAAGVAIYTPANATFVDDADWQAAYPELVDFIFSSEDEFQKKRPRLELMVNVAAATTHLHDTAGNGLMKDMRPDAFEGTVTLGIITEANVLLHRAYRAKCRKIMGDEFPATWMPYHDINKCLEAGTTLEYAPEEGLFRSTINYDLHFNIKPDAWPTT